MKFIIALLLIAGCGKGKNDAEGPGVVEFHPISEMKQVADKQEPGVPALIGGRVADPKDWPASMYADMGGARCTATIVGPKSLLIAAHCVDNGASAAFTLNGARYTSVCTHSREYSGNSTADYTLCQIDKEVTGIQFEVMNQDELFVKMGDEILLTGYGCTSPNGTGGNDGKYRIGESTVVQLPSGTSNDIVAKGGAALCYGDSGGPAFKYVDKAKTIRKLITVNSRGNIRDTSYLPSLATSEGKRFLKAWSDKTGEKICGLHADTKGCRGTDEPGPGPSPTPPPQSDCKKTYDKVGVCLFTPAQAGADNCYKEAGKIFACLDALVSAQVLKYTL